MIQRNRLQKRAHLCEKGEQKYLSTTLIRVLLVCTGNELREEIPEYHKPKFGSPMYFLKKYLWGPKLRLCPERGMSVQQRLALPRASLI